MKVNGYALVKAFYNEVAQNEAMQIGVTASHHSLYTWICELRNRIQMDQPTREAIDLPVRYTLTMAFIGSDHTLKKCIDDLEKWGIIEVLQRGPNTITKVKLAVAFLRQHSSQSVANMRQRCDNGATTVRQTKTEETEETKKTSDVPTFEEFWGVYDYKKDKAKAEKKWKTLSAQDKKDIMKVVPEYVKSTPNKQYRKYPSKFLNEERWKDEEISQPRAQAGLNGNHMAPPRPVTPTNIR